MSNFTAFDLNFSKLILKSNHDKVQQWAQDTSNPELSQACQMLMQAAEAEK